MFKKKLGGFYEDFYYYVYRNFFIRFFRGE